MPRAVVFITGGIISLSLPLFFYLSGFFFIQSLFPGIVSPSPLDHLPQHPPSGDAARIVPMLSSTNGAEPIAQTTTRVTSKPLLAPSQGQSRDRELVPAPTARARTHNARCGGSSYENALRIKSFRLSRIGRNKSEGGENMSGFDGDKRGRG